MRALIDITHPAHAHFFRHPIRELQRRGHVVAVTVRDKDRSVELLREMGIQATVLHGRAGAPWRILGRDAKLWWFCLHFKPDVLAAISGMFVAHVGWAIRKPAVVWDDTEHQSLAHRITFPFVTAVKSPDCYKLHVPGKHYLYAGTHEFSYLHPNRFTPDRRQVLALGINPDEKYCIIRFVSWSAAHDVGAAGIEESQKVRFVRRIAEYARPYITAEGPIPPELEPYRLRIPFGMIHHVLAFAALYVGEGATMASEAAILGTPAVYVNTLKLGYIDMHTRYGLVRQAENTAGALEHCLAWLRDPQAAQKAAEARRKLLSEKIDVTMDVVRTLEDFAAWGRKGPPGRTDP